MLSRDRQADHVKISQAATDKTDQETRDGTLVRIQFEITRKKFAEIERVMRDCEIETRRDYFNNAITLLKWAVDESKKGHTIATVDEKNGKFRELQMPILSNASAKGASD